MRKLIKWLDDHLEEALMVFLLGVICIVMMLQVIMRYFIQSPLSWAEELCRYCFIYSGLIGVAFCAKKDTLLRMDALILLLPEKARKLWGKILDVFLLALFGFLFIKSTSLLEATAKQGQFSPALHLPYYVLYFSLTLGLGLASLRLAQKLFLAVKKRRDAS
ncbi:TRAP transporter small permease [Hominifimenecus sp. rT4P-3]|uniref:TRAP transporter small permease n=1 Tax=Hominifimenecus sp. rT4P-3 TaxID=3242979 RepID=UPI003DA5FA8B